jgi:hypothetical protein
MTVQGRVSEFLFGPPNQSRPWRPSVERSTNPVPYHRALAVPEDLDEIAWYRTQDNRHDIKFWFRDCHREGWRAYIMSHIDYGARASDAHSTHRLLDRTLDLHYVCWDRPIATKAECQAIAVKWSELTFLYINEGRRFG